jgi:hypothetical protein
MVRKLLLLAAGGIVFILAGSAARADELGQVNVSPTPVSIQLPSAIPLVADTPTPTSLAPLAANSSGATAAPTGPVMLEAKSEANVRASADLNADKLGTIRAGDTYAVMGRYFRWIKFQYDPAPDKIGWVYDELVNFIGDEKKIPDLTIETTPTQPGTDPQGATDPLAAVTLTPGAALTVTANARFIAGPDAAGGAGAAIQPQAVGQGDITVPALPVPGVEGTPQVLPTFTYPPNVVAIAPTAAFAQSSGPDATATASATTSRVTRLISNGVPPIGPIILLGALGILGLLLSSLRR